MGSIHTTNTTKKTIGILASLFALAGTLFILSIWFKKPIETIKAERILKWDEVAEVGEDGKPKLKEWRIRDIKEQIANLQSAEQYALVAITDGTYECYHCPRGVTSLKTEEVWKYGITSKGVEGRYDLDYLTRMGLKYVVQLRGTYQECLVEEKRKIGLYPLHEDNLKRMPEERLARPPGNKVDYGPLPLILMRGCLQGESFLLSHFHTMKRIQVESGQRFGRLTILKELPSRLEKFGKRGLQKRRYVLSICDCGNQKEASLKRLCNGTLSSCGCLFNETRINEGSFKPKHGMCSNRFYKIWSSMKQRAVHNHINNPRYKSVGICERRMEFENFYKDMFEAYIDHVKEFGEKETTIERVDFTGNYGPTNCTWATVREQNRNKRTVRRYKGKRLVDRCRELGIPNNKVNARISKWGWSLEEALGLSPRAK